MQQQHGHSFFILFGFISLLLHNFHDTQLFSGHGAILLIIELPPAMEDEDTDYDRV